MGVLDKIILAGFMGTGKTTTGKLIAGRLSWRFADTDYVIERRAGKTVAAIFAEDGESAFRKLEAEFCQEIHTLRNTVIATGGGILINPQNREVMLSAGFVVCLWASAEQIAARLEHDHNRPLLAAPDRMERLNALLDARREIYASLPYQIETTGLTPFAVSEKVIQLWRSAR